MKTSSFLYVNTCTGILSRSVSASSKSKMSAIHHANRKKIIPNMCKICVEITNILWGFFYCRKS